MSQQIDAIYEGGVFRPVQPLAIPDKVRVKLTVDPAFEIQPEVVSDQSTNAALLSRQQAALDELRRELAKLSQTKNDDGWSVRQHDELLYGGGKK